MTIQDKLTLRKWIKSRKPDYKYSGSWRRIHRLGRWRRPKGHQSKMRLKKRGYPRVVEVGYGSPRDVKGMHPKGFFPIIVYSVKELELIDPKTQGVIIAKSVGLLKKRAIFEEANKKGITVLNLSKDKLESLLKERESSKKRREEEKKKKETKMKKSLEEAVKESEKDKEKSSESPKEDTQKSTQKDSDSKEDSGSKKEKSNKKESKEDSKTDDQDKK